MHPNWPAAWDSGLDCGLKVHGLPWPPANKFHETKVNRALAYKLLVLHGELAHTLGLCVFLLWGSEDSCLTPKRMALLYSTLTGITMNEFELMKTAERVWNLKRCFNVREGLTRKDEKLPKRLLEPIETGPTKDESIKDFDGLLNEYYEASGWNKKTGVPTRKKLEELGLKDVADELTKLGYLT